MNLLFGVFASQHYTLHQWAIQAVAAWPEWHSLPAVTAALLEEP